MIHDNRESWLNGVAAGMAPLFEALGAPLLDRVRVAIGFTSAGRRSRAIGECWDNRRSADGHFEIFIRPDLAHAPDAMPAQIAAILAHELVHAAVGIKAGHGKPFKRIALGLGLVGPMRATTPGDAFLAAVAPILAAADGVVSFSGWRGGYGRCIEVTHGNGLITRYAHMSALVATVGQPVKRGQKIGAMGSTGRSTGTHLHFEVRINGQAVDPAKFLESDSKLYDIKS